MTGNANGHVRRISSGQHMQLGEGFLLRSQPGRPLLKNSVCGVLDLARIQIPVDRTPETIALRFDNFERHRSELTCIAALYHCE